jgi:serine/threonine protein kinase
MDRDRWQAVSPYLDELLELEAGARAARLAQVRAAQPALAADLATLLAEHGALVEAHFLDVPVAFAGADPDAALAGQAVGSYTLETRLGQGGMGSVWRARRSDGRFEGTVAVKLLNAALVGRAGGERFRREGSILARLTHDHIARLLDAGVLPTGQPYLVLEHVEGEHLDRYCDGRGLDVEARVRLFLDVVAAVAHAHASLVVHRDLKPSNVLVRADGQVKLLDFGIAKLLEDETQPGDATRLTREGGWALTPAYAAPEQVTGGPVTTATDVYALGVLLYELLAGRHPAGAALRSPADLVKAIVDTEPLRLSDAVAAGPAEGDEGGAIGRPRRATPERWRRLLQGDLDTIVAKALKKRPAERYGSVTALADDLRRYLNHQPIGARPDTAAYRARKFARRHRIPVALAACARTRRRAPPSSSATSPCGSSRGPKRSTT